MTTRRALLHVTNGESAGGSLRETRLDGTVLPWLDALHEGPVPAVARDDLIQVRAGFLADCGWGDRREIASSLDARDLELLAAYAGGFQVVLWFEHDLFDQLQLLDVLALALDADAAPPDLIVIGSFDGKPSFGGLGELTPAELETLWPSRKAAEPATIRAGGEAWAALRAPEPTSLAGWATRDFPQLPFLSPALRRWLEELPAPADGLSGTERRLLQALAAGVTTPPVAFLAVQRLEKAPFLGDSWFYRALSDLGQGARRLIETDDGGPIPFAPPRSDGRRFARLGLRLTARGEAVLGGEADRVELLGIDRWIGGTHVTPENAWRWDPAARRLLRPHAA